MAEVKYRDLKKQLEEVLDQLQNGDTDVDEAIKLHEKGKKLVAQLELYLKKISAK